MRPGFDLRRQDLQPDEQVNHRDGLRVAMNSFLELHRLSISGTINIFDRVIFKGHLNGFFPDGASFTSSFSMQHAGKSDRVKWSNRTTARMFPLSHRLVAQ